jgi:hypothetical protein
MKSRVLCLALLVVAAAYSAILHFFSYEQFLRPVVEDIVSEDRDRTGPASPHTAPQRTCTYLTPGSP